MKYASDYLGRMKEITYPDGEIVRYGYGYGGQIKSVKGERKGTKFDYVSMIGYDEYGQRVYIRYGNGTETKYKYDPYRRWLSGLDTSNNAAGKVQDMKYTFDSVGNVSGYENNARGYTTKQSYSYDALYQLTGVQGTSKSHPGGPGGNEEYKTDYRQKYDFNRIGNMTNKVSEESVSNTNRVGVELNYALEYEYYKGTHKAERIGSRYYDYDLNGNVLAEREGSHAVNKEADRSYYQDGDKYWADYGFGLVKPKPDTPDDGIYQRNYKWNERNLLSETSDNTYTVQYRYGAYGQRALKLNVTSGRSVVYFNKMWQTSDSRMEWLQSKHIYLNEDRIATKYNSEGNINTQAEKERTYYYHSDHLGSAQVVTNHEGKIHERLEYTPYGELWIDWKSETALEDKTPFRFTGKEMDAETGFYYYGARYLDPKTSRWISGDPAMGEYLPVAGKGSEGLPGMGGIYTPINMHAYHYSFNNPIRYTDPDGRSGEQEEGETWSVSQQLSYLRICVYNGNKMGEKEKAEAAKALRIDIRSGRYDLDGLMTGPDGNEQFMNETLRDFLNTSDTGLAYKHGDMTKKNGWSRHPGDSEHQNDKGDEKNRKYTNKDGREAVFKKVGNNWILSDHPLDKGTYNYAKNAYQWWSESEHGRWDMAPYYRQHNLVRQGFTIGLNPRVDYNRNGSRSGIRRFPYY